MNWSMMTKSPGTRSSRRLPTADNDTISVTPQRFSASILARKLISEGGSRCPRPWRGTNTTGWPSSDPKQNSSEVGPKGDSTGRHSTSSSPSIWSIPLPPIIPITGRVICGLVDGGSDLALGRVEHPGSNHQEQQHLEPGTMSGFEVGFRGPGQKGDHVVCHLRHGGRRAVGESHGTIAERRRHRNLMPRKVLVVLHTLQQIEPGWRVLIARQ